MRLFFRTLYNASFLNQENSNLILSFLVDSEGKDLIVSGLPSGTKIAHKIGIAESEKILTDYGIVYLKQYRYLLCVSVEGDIADGKKEVIREISKGVSDFFINRTNSELF